MNAPNTAVNVPDEYSANEIAITAQQRTIVEMIDRFFSTPQRPLVDNCIGAAFRLKTMIEELIEDDGDDDYGSLGESKELAGSIMLNLGGWKSNSAKQHVDHGARCRCDNCVAARSDEHFDRAGAR